MKIKLTREEKAELLKAVSKGELDTSDIERIVSEIRGANKFEELMKSLPDLQ